MKSITCITLIVILDLFAAFSQPVQVEITDKNVLKALDMYCEAANNFLDSIKFSDSKKGVVVVDYYNYDFISGSLYSDSLNLILNYDMLTRPKGDFKISLIQDDIFFFENYPLVYFVQNGRLVVVYLGLEDFISVDKKQIRMFTKKVRERIPARSVLYGLPIWFIRVDGEIVTVLNKH